MVRDAILSKDLVFDTGVLKNIFKANAEEREQAFWNSLDSRNFFIKRNPFTISSLLLSLECLGFKPEEVSPLISDSTLRNQVRDLYLSASTSEPGQIHAAVIKLLISWYRNSDRFAPGALLGRCRSELKYRTKYGQLCFQQLFETNFSREEEYWSSTIPRVAFYFSHAFDYGDIGLPEAEITKLDYYFLGTARHMLLNNYQGYNFARAADRFIRRAFKIKRGTELPPIYEEEGENVDTEIIHYLTVGCYQSGKHNNVAAFTTEKIASWRPRIINYYSFLNFVLEGATFTVFPGTLYEVDPNSGEIRDRLDIYEEFSDEISLQVRQRNILERTVCLS